MVAVSLKKQATAQQARDIVTEEHDNGQQRAEVHGDVECQPLILPLHEVRDQDEMARARNRQELGQSLDNGEYDDLNSCHNVCVLSARLNAVGVSIDPLRSAMHLKRSPI